MMFDDQQRSKRSHHSATALTRAAVTESGMSKAITHKTHFGQIAKIEYQGALVTISMMRWGILKRNFMPSPFTFRPRYETAIFDGPVANPTKCFCTFFYADEATALEEWGPLVQGIEDQGLMATLTDRRFLLSPAKVGLFINRTRQFAPVGVDAPLVMSS
jgi:hypothetical protein